MSESEMGIQQAAFELLFPVKKDEGGEHNLKRIGLIFLGVMITALFVPMTFAKPNQSEFDYWQPGDYYGWGPALYYGQDVAVHYLAVNTWVLNMKDNDDGTWTIRQELTQKGIAEIWDITRTILLDTKNFRVSEVAQGTVDYLAEWYHVYDLQYIEKHEYHWIIPGVYHYHVAILDGWSSAIFEYWVRNEGWTVLYEI